MKILHDVHDERLDLYRDLRHAQSLHTRSRVFLTDGEKITASILQSTLHVVSILLTEELYAQYIPAIQSKIKPEQCFILSKKDMDALVGFDLHSPMMSIVEEPETPDLLSLKGPIIALNGIVNSDNVGGIIRNAIGLGYKSIITDSTTSSPYLRRAVRVSMGAVAFAQCVKSNDLVHDLEKLRNSRGIPIISAEITNDSIDVNSFVFPQDFILILGSEGNGVQSEVLALSDKIVHVNMSEPIKSLNVASSSAIILHAAGSQTR